MSYLEVIKFNKPIKNVRLTYFGDVSGDPRGIELLIAQERTRWEKCLGDLIERIEKSYLEMEKELSVRMPQSVMAIVKRISGGLELERENIEKIIDEVLSKSCPENENLDVFLNASDYAKFVDAGGIKIQKKYPKVSFKADESLKNGDCLVKSKFGLVDATIEAKIEQIEQELA